MHSSSYNLELQNSINRQMLHHNHHVELYPTHPGPRNGKRSRDHGSERSSSSYDDKSPSPVLTRDAYSNEMVKSLRGNKSRNESGSRNSQLSPGRRDGSGDGSTGSSSRSASTAVAFKVGYGEWSRRT